MPYTSYAQAAEFGDGPRFADVFAYGVADVFAYGVAVVDAISIRMRGVVVGAFVKPVDPRVMALAAALAALLAPRTSDSEERLSLREAAVTAATTVRILEDAIRIGALPAYGSQRDRSVKRAELLKWADARRVNIEMSDAQMDRINRRVERMVAKKRARVTKTPGGA